MHKGQDQVNFVEVYMRRKYFDHDIQQVPSKPMLQLLQVLRYSRQFLTFILTQTHYNSFYFQSNLNEYIFIFSGITNNGGRKATN